MSEKTLSQVARDPGTAPEVLQALAANHPETRVDIATNPATYPGLLDWLAAIGDPAIDAALAARGTATATLLPPPPPPAGMGADQAAPQVAPAAQANPATQAGAPGAPSAGAAPATPATPPTVATTGNGTRCGHCDALLRRQSICPSCGWLNTAPAGSIAGVWGQGAIISAAAPSPSVARQRAEVAAALPSAYAPHDIPAGYIPRPSAQRGPGAKPAALTASVVLWVVGIVVGAISCLIGIIQLIGLSGQLSGYGSLAGALWLIYIVTLGLLIFAACCAYQLSVGRNWARVVLAVLAGLLLASTLISIDTATWVTWIGVVAALFASVLSFMPDASDYIAEHRR